MQLGKVSIPSDISKALLEGSALQLTPRHNQSVGKEKTELSSWVLTFFRSQIRACWSILDSQSTALMTRRRESLPGLLSGRLEEESSSQRPDQPIQKA
jgi:hypothetical protein